MAFTVTTIGGTPFSIKFLVKGDNTDTNVIIDNATLLAAIGSQKSFLRDLLSATYASKQAAIDAITDTVQVDLRVDGRSDGGTNVVAWAAEIDIDKAGLPTIIVGSDGVAPANARCYIKLIFEHTYVR